MTESKKKAMYVKMGDFLTKHRIASGLSQKEVSVHLGYSSSQFISNCERGLCLPPLRKLRSICDLYGVKPKKLADLLIKYNAEVVYQEMQIGQR